MEYTENVDNRTTYKQYIKIWNIQHYNTGAVIKNQEVYVPTQLIQWYARQEDKGPESDEILEMATERMLKLSSIRNQEGKDIYVGIKPKINTIMRLEEYLGKSVWEVGIHARTNSNT